MISGKTQCSPADVSYDPSRLDALNRHIQRLIDADALQAGSYCLSRNGKVFANAAIGRLCYRKDDAREMRPDNIQWIASITKLFCASAIFKLVEDGLLRLTQSVGEVLKEMSVPPYNTITFAQLLSHTSGLNPDGGCFENKYYKDPWDLMILLKDRNWLEAGLSVGMRSKPGTEWAYCSFGFVILGEAISRISGVNVHDFIQKEIFDPCGMADTAFPWQMMSDDATRERAIGLIKRMPIRGEKEEKELADILKGIPEQDGDVFKDVPGTAGSIASTGEDLCKFGDMLLNQGTTLEGKRVLGRRTVCRMTEPFTGPEIRDYCWGSPGVHRPYALGPDRRRTADCLYSPSYYYHEGSGGCALIIDPEERMVAAWFVPFVNDVWSPSAIYSTGAVIWSGLK
jgi:CubicO group peptidase (beta-lactamase class C family)